MSASSCIIPANSNPAVQSQPAPCGAEQPVSLSQRSHAIKAYISTNKPAIGRLIRGTFEISSFAEAEKLSTMLASHCPNPESAAIGIWELLSNAIEHGNLDIDFETKASLLMSGRYTEEIERRSGLSPYRDRIVTVSFRQFPNFIRFRIADEGSGFDFSSPDLGAMQSSAPNGRGIAMARAMTFSTIQYRGAGNIVDATIRKSA